MARMEMPEVQTAAITPNASSADVLFELGMTYCNGRGVGQDYVAAHKWFNLAALKGNSAARHYRGEISLEMSAVQMAEAQRLARAWLTVH